MKMIKKIIHGTFICAFLLYLIYEFGIDKDTRTNIAFVESDVIALSPIKTGYIDKILLPKNASFAKGDILVAMEREEALRDLRIEKLRIEQEQEKQKQLLIQKASLDEQIAFLEIQHKNLLEQKKIRERQLYRITSSLYSKALSLEEIDERKISLLSLDKALLANQQELSILLYSLSEIEEQISINKNQVAQIIVAIADKQYQIELKDIEAPFDGVISDVVRHRGELAESGDTILLVVDTSNIWIEAYFKESVAENLNIGTQVQVKIDALPDANITGTIESVSPLAGAKLSALPSNYATGNFTRIPQRIPVKISINEKQFLSKLKPGYSVEVSLKNTGA